MAKNVSSISSRLSKESTCVRILEWDKQGERSVQRLLLLRLSIVYLSDTLYPINTRPPYLPIAVVAVSRLFFLFACEVRSFICPLFRLFVYISALQSGQLMASFPFPRWIKNALDWVTATHWSSYEIGIYNNSIILLATRLPITI